MERLSKLIDGAMNRGPSALDLYLKAFTTPKPKTAVPEPKVTYGKPKNTSRRKKRLLHRHVAYQEKTDE